jgi:hypothetical protein
LKLLVTFQTIGAAFDFERAMKAKQCPVEITLTPRCLGASCSYSAIVEYEQDGAPSPIDLLQSERIEYSKTYQIAVNGKGDEIYEPYKPPVRAVQS